MQPLSLSAQEALFLRLRSQRLVEPAPSLPDLFGDVVALQAQDLTAAPLAIRVRSSGITAEQVSQLLRLPRSFAWTWSLRGTLHLMTAEDARWLVPFLSPQFIAGDRRRMRELGWDEEQAAEAIRLIQSALAHQERMTRAEIIDLLAFNGYPSEGQAPVHLLARAAFEGVLCPVPDAAPTPSVYALFEDWVGTPQPLPREEALQRLVVRYLQAYAPAGVNDLAAWSGLKLSDARLAWQVVEDQITPVTIEGQPAGLLNPQRPWLEETIPLAPVVRLLPRFDAYLLGYANRGLFVDPAVARQVNAGGGMIAATLLVDGRVRGTWKTTRRKQALELMITPFEPVPDEWLLGIEAEAAALRSFLSQEIAVHIERS